MRARAASDCAELATLRAVVQAMRIMVGIVFAATVFDTLRQHGYTEAGYRRTIDTYLAHGTQPGIQRDIMRFVRDHAVVAAPLQELTEITLAVCLLVGIAVPLASLVAGIQLAGLTASEWGSTWTWELPPLVLMAFLVTAAAVPALRAHGPRVWIFGRPDGGGVLDRVGIAGRVGLALLVGVVVWYLMHVTRRPDATALKGGIAVVVLLLGNIALDAAAARRRSSRPSESVPAVPADGSDGANASSRNRA